MKHWPALSAFLLAVACGGTTSGPGLVGVPDGGTQPGCVNVQIGPGDLSCNVDGDCTVTVSGMVCSGSCGCGSTAVNMQGAARIGQAVSGLSLEACPCAAPGIPHCLAGQCALCGFGPNRPAGCPDAG